MLHTLSEEVVWRVGYLNVRNLFTDYDYYGYCAKWGWAPMKHVEAEQSSDHEDNSLMVNATSSN
jgi:hypothetical protein